MELNAFLTKEQSQRIRCGWLANLVERSIIRHAPRVIVVSEPLRREVHELGQPFTAIAKMPMAVNLEKFNPIIDGSAVRRAHGLEDRFVIGYVGTLAGWHGIRLLYDMARELKSQGAPAFAFLIVGGDERKLDEHRRAAAEQGLSDELRFIGSVPHEAVPGHLRAMDTAIIPDTTYWSSPAKLFEYQASGIPVLAPEYPAILEALDDGVEGLIFTPRDVPAMARAARRMMDSAEKRQQMGQAARQRAEREHSWSHNAQEIVRLYAELGAPAAAAPGNADTHPGAGAR
jgi:glycosyltransferase involved in cell wall biosynthesis